jgi:hypothetical protein
MSISKVSRSFAALPLSVLMKPHFLFSKVKKKDNMDRHDSKKKNKLIKLEVFIDPNNPASGPTEVSNG